MCIPITICSSPLTLYLSIRLLAFMSSLILSLGHILLYYFNIFTGEEFWYGNWLAMIAVLIREVQCFRPTQKSKRYQCSDDWHFTLCRVSTEGGQDDLNQWSNKSSTAHGALPCPSVSLLIVPWFSSGSEREARWFTVVKNEFIWSLRRLHWFKSMGPKDQKIVFLQHSNVLSLRTHLFCSEPSSLYFLKSNQLSLFWFRARVDTSFYPKSTDVIFRWNTLTFLSVDWVHWYPSCYDVQCLSQSVLKKRDNIRLSSSCPPFFSVFLKNLLSQCISEECFSLEDSPFNFESFCIKCLSNPLFSPSVIILRQKTNYFRHTERQQDRYFSKSQAFSQKNPRRKSLRWHQFFHVRLSIDKTCQKHVVFEWSFWDAGFHI